MIDPDELDVRRADLARMLRQLRQQSGLSGSRLAARVTMSQSKISKIENGRLVPTAIDVDRILKALDVPADTADEVLGLVRLANTEFHSVRSSLRRGLHHRQQELAAIEASTHEFRYFLPVMITGLLHTMEYARRSLGKTVGDQSLTIARRLERQAVLGDKTKNFTFLLTEAAVRWPLCPPPLMAAQVDRLAAVSQQDNVRLGVIPFSAEVADGPLNTFTIYDQRIATAETIGGLMIMRDPRDIALHLEIFSFFEKHAFFGRPARVILARIADEFRSRSSP